MIYDAREVRAAMHRCRTPDIDQHSHRDEGSIWQCPECSTYWFVGFWETAGPCGYTWKPVQWWHFGVRRRIREAS